MIHLGKHPKKENELQKQIEEKEKEISPSKSKNFISGTPLERQALRNKIKNITITKS